MKQPPALYNHLTLPLVLVGLLLNAWSLFQYVHAESSLCSIISWHLHAKLYRQSAGRILGRPT